MADDTFASELLHEPRDREYVAQLTDAVERETVVSSLARHRRAGRLEVGDAIPPLTLRRPDDAGFSVGLEDLVRDRPLVLVFGSYT